MSQSTETQPAYPLIPHSNKVAQSQVGSVAQFLVGDNICNTRLVTVAAIDADKFGIKRLKSAVAGELLKRNSRKVDRGSTSHAVSGTAFADAAGR